MILLPVLVLAVAIAAVVIIGRWVSARLRAAQWRQAYEAWQEIIPVSPVAGVPGWPAGETGMMHFFGTDYVDYDPAADAAVYCEDMAADVQAYIDSLHQAA